VTPGDGAADASSENEIGDAAGRDGEPSVPGDERGAALDGDANASQFDASDSPGDSGDAGCAADAEGGCKVPFCGDGVVDRGEECDKGAGNNTGGYNGCNANCTLGPHCGDGVTSGVEGCDKGSANGTFIGECRPDCTGVVDITEFNLNFVDRAPFDIVTGPDGNLWFTESKGNAIGQMSPKGNFLKYVFPMFSGSGPHQITVGADGNLWFTETVGNSVGRCAPNAMSASSLVLPNADSNPAAITTGSDGAIWFIMQGPAKVGRLTPGLSYTDYEACSGRCDLYGIASAGDKIWFTDARGNSIRSMTTAGADLKDHAPPTLAAGLFGLALGPDGNLWFTETTASKVGFIVPSNGTFGPEFILTGGAQPTHITAGPDGNIWFSEGAGNRIGRVTPGGKVSEASIPTSAGTPAGITAAPDGNVWFVEYQGNKVARINIGKP
jgi:streptogramin lyase